MQLTFLSFSDDLKDLRQYIKAGLICVFPGRVLDEANRLMKKIREKTMGIPDPDGQIDLEGSINTVQVFFESQLKPSREASYNEYLATRRKRKSSIEGPDQPAKRSRLTEVEPETEEGHQGEN